MKRSLLLIAMLVAFFRPLEGIAQGANDFGFTRVRHGWTNYSTAFNATHDPGLVGEYATLACFYTPAVDVRLLEFSAVVIWFGSGGHRLDFSDFSFRVHIWSGLDAFIGNPRQGNLSVIPFAAPTGGSTTVPDAITRGGRPAYLVRFSLTNAAITLTQCQTVLVGLSTHAGAPQAGELYVPTAPFDGLSDVQGGNIVSFGWVYLINAGGLTLYSGQLATELKVQPIGAIPGLRIESNPPEIHVTWPTSAGCFTLESSDGPSEPLSWLPVAEPPVLLDGTNRVVLATSDTQRWFRLRREPHSLVRP